MCFRDRKSGNSEEKSRSDRIDRTIKADKRRQDKEVKILLLGAGESGKSTVLKQMRLIHSNGFRESERKAFRNVIFQNIIEAFLMMFDIMDAQKTAFQDSSNQVCPITSSVLSRTDHVSVMSLSWKEKESWDSTKVYRESTLPASKICGQIWVFKWPFSKGTNTLCTIILTSRILSMLQPGELLMLLAFSKTWTVYLPKAGFPPTKISCVRD